VAIRLIAGLGNPGQKYKDTRHNIGFTILDRVAGVLGVSFELEKFRGLVSEARHGAGKILLLKPLTFMNVSGESVALAARNQVDGPEEVLIVYDDVELPLGRLRLRAGGSGGTHNGMKSVIERLGTRDIPRLRAGVGTGDYDSKGLAPHVLGKFRPEERGILETVTDRATKAVLACIDDGIDSAMNLYNRAADDTSQEPDNV
jgi:PTH1 family peptidyl-tRNA hydrolase